MSIEVCNVECLANIARAFVAADGQLSLQGREIEGKGRRNIIETNEKLFIQHPTGAGMLALLGLVVVVKSQRILLVVPLACC